jgi:SAM-dependent methyltransferase
MRPSHPPVALDEPSPWVKRLAPLIPAGEVLDLACGGGRHARLLAAMGHAVLAVDRDADALNRVAGDRIAALQIDLEKSGDQPFVWPFAANRFAGIVVTNYLHRPLFPHLAASLAPDGVLIYETFAQGNGRFGKPSNPDFLLEPGELLEMARMNFKHSLRVIAYEDGFIDQPRPAMVQRICAVKVDSGGATDSFRLF